MFKYTHAQWSWMLKYTHDMYSGVGCLSIHVGFFSLFFLTPTQLLTQSDYTTVNISGGFKHVLKIKSGSQVWQSVFKPRAPLYITCVYLNI